MMHLNFESLEQFEDLFSYTNRKVVDGVFSAINDSYLFSKKTAKIFNITFQDNEVGYEITLPQEQWCNALSVVLRYYEDNGTSDECIDTWKLIQNIEKFHKK